MDEREKHEMSDLESELGETVEWLEGLIKTSETIREKCVEFIINGAHGVYLPKVFIDSRLGWQLEQIKTQTSEETIEILRGGPEVEFYWEAWEEVLDVEFAAPSKHPGHGGQFILHQDSDLFIINTSELEQFTDEEVQYFWDNWL